ncbi:uncharacterized protein B0H18DRAFT_394807 [Fomitopsis serialis]|uniref:uncharacterized protein n=1 Tax=Fomitopsis serialis TaxID=139415 RepID=UPI002007941F|nr:uncharacterized protein B0H18DRAFT_394807 [Neoantrodia serialis]KAH9924894.1 hypothetical protein B0H18DRAFT_394807 [Neoantrodia serialis]
MSGSTHRALRMDDILQCIFESSSSMQRKDDLNSRKNLARVARTCKAFSRYALPQLWRSLPSVNPLLSLLAPLRLARTDEQWLQSGCYEANNPPERNRGYSWVFDGTITPANVSRFQEYAAFVHALNIRRFPQLDPTIFSCVGHVGSLRGALLPALEVLDCETSQSMYQTVRLVMGPSLRSFACNLRASPVYLAEHAESDTGKAHMLETLLSDLHFSSPHLETLMLSAFMLWWDLRPALAFTELRTLDLSKYVSSKFGTDFWQSLAMVPHLHTLRLPTTVIGELAPFPGGFARLEDLHVTGSTHDITRILRFIAPSRLRVLSISGTFDYPRCAHEVLEPVCDRCSNTLTEVRVECAGGSFRDPVSGLMDVLQPFVPARRIRIVVLQFHDGAFSFTGADLCALTQYWPALHIFELANGSDRVEAMTAPPSLQAIVDFAHACPDLEEVSLPKIAWPLASAPGDEEQYTCRPNNLRVVRTDCIGFGAGKGREEIAADRRMAGRILYRLFPALDVQRSREVYGSVHPIFLGRFWLDAIEELQKGQ